MGYSGPELAVHKQVLKSPRLVINGVEGWGKTTIGAHAPDAAIVMARGETGYLTLLGAKRVPALPSVLIESWPSLMHFLEHEIEKEKPHRTYTFDSVGCFERLCHEHVCWRDFDGVWGDKGFASFQTGYDVSIAEWNLFTQKLDALHAKGSIIILLSHSQIRPFKNPSGPDYDRFVADSHHKTWAVTCKWADCVLFGHFLTVIDQKKGGRAKGIGGRDRVLHSEHTDAWDAKNRYGMAETIKMPEDPSLMWETIHKAIKGELTQKG